MNNVRSKKTIGQVFIDNDLGNYISKSYLYEMLRRGEFDCERKGRAGYVFSKKQELKLVNVIKNRG